MRVSNARDCGLSKSIITISFDSYSANPSMSFDPTVYQTPVPGWEDNQQLYEIVILAILMIIL